jgi:hypothetical protein
LTGLLGFFVDHFPEENGQTSTPSAKWSLPNKLIWIEIWEESIVPAMLEILFRR